MQATVSPKRIAYRRHCNVDLKDEGGEVSVHCPHPGAFFWAQRGGLWGQCARGFLDEQVRRQMIGGIKEDHARRWVDALQFGGLTEAEAWALIRDRDCERFGYDHALMDFSDLPTRAFRNAWRMNHNGAVGVVMDLARPMQWDRIWSAVESENKRRERAFEPIALLSLPGETLRAAVRNARDEDELSRIWPEGLERIAA